MISSSHGAPFEIRHCRKIGEGIKLRKDSKSIKFTINIIEQLEDDIINLPDLPVDLDVGEMYTISCWDTNYIIEGLSNKTFKVIEHYGSLLKIGLEYILISPCY